MKCVNGIFLTPLYQGHVTGELNEPRSNIPDCKSKEYLKKRMNTPTQQNKTLARKNNYERLLS